MAAHDHRQQVVKANQRDITGHHQTDFPGRAGTDGGIPGYPLTQQFLCRKRLMILSAAIWMNSFGEPVVGGGCFFSLLLPILTGSFSGNFQDLQINLSVVVNSFPYH